MRDQGAERLVGSEEVVVMAMERRGRVIGSDDHANCAKQEEHDRMTKPEAVSKRRCIVEPDPYSRGTAFH